MIVEYLWLDVDGELRTKARFLDKFDKKLVKNICNSKYIKDNKKKYLSYIPQWNYDGSSTGQAITDNSETILKPVNVIKNPFQNGLLVLCENFNMNDKIVPGNNRSHASLKFNKNKNIKCWFGVEQEFFFFDKKSNEPLLWSERKNTSQDKYYCGVNNSSQIERDIMDELFRTSINVGLSMSGINQEVAPSQWEYQIGPVEGIETADQLIFAKFILQRLCQKYDLYPNFYPKPTIIDKNFNGSGCHVNISTKKSRKNKGYYHILKYLENFDKDHKNFVNNYTGVDNELRLTGKNETSSKDKFSFSVGGRATSVRIPFETRSNEKGYFEDRRPGSNIDYYLILSKYLDYLY